MYTAHESKKRLTTCKAPTQTALKESIAQSVTSANILQTSSTIAVGNIYMQTPSAYKKKHDLEDIIFHNARSGLHILSIALANYLLFYSKVQVQ